MLKLQKLYFRMHKKVKKLTKKKPRFHARFLMIKQKMLKKNKNNDKSKKQIAKSKFKNE